MEHDRNREGEVAAGRKATQCDLMGIQFQLVCVGSKVYDSIGAIFNANAERVFGCQSVLDTDEDCVRIFDDCSGPTSIVGACA